MKKAQLFLFCILVLCLSVSAQSKEEQSVAAAVKQLNRAMIDGDRKTLDQLTSGKLSYGHSNGLIEDKSAFMTAILDGVSGFTSIDLTEETITVSNDVAIVRHKFSAGTDNKGQQPGRVNLSVLQIWQKEKGK
jgi:ketosteroid isomerase-like protein